VQFVFFFCLLLPILASKQPATEPPTPYHPPIKASFSHDQSKERFHPIHQMTHTRSQSFTIGKL